MKKTGYSRSLERKQEISGKRIVGIDPAMQNHQAVVVDESYLHFRQVMNGRTKHSGITFLIDCTSLWTSRLR